ncbi:TOTE conflict system archaeo-eukaryotic primase domain-containing protein [Ferviditalea candida]|uniref:DEAD/DEAH box helicase family protein n=1 Tax=Ferviditalea candida TaxID=3108399 RepID=A0ABU5ZKP8_9BACL|nr:DEAD/DEAH box helicase family protein [Paenibacillaceae bacterium T2]
MINGNDDPDQLVFEWSNELEQLKRRLQQVTEERDQLKRQNILLLQENSLLKKRVLQPSEAEIAPLSVSGNDLILSEQTPLAPRSSQKTATVTKHSTIEEKVRFYRSLFRGRDDVYAVRGMDKQGKTVYYRKRELLGKENGKYIWGDDVTLTDETIRRHMEDEHNPVTVGLYPMLTDESCWFLAIDFDKATWKEDTAAFLETCRSFAIPAALERSRSGNGGHVWIFFEEPVPARTARQMGSVLLTATLEKRNQLGLDSYDRMFPNQDTLPRDKKLGNLIALPLQRAAGKQGNSLFIDSDFSPYPDQWVYLSSLPKMSKQEVEAMIGVAQQTGAIIRIANPLMEDDEIENDTPWLAAASSGKMDMQVKLPAVIHAVHSQMLFIEKEQLSSAQLNLFIRTAAFQNPEFYRDQKMRLSTWGIPRIINCTEDHPKHLALPRGCLEEVTRLCTNAGAVLELQDERQAGVSIAIQFRGDLRERQQQAVQELAKADTGVLSATTAFGKTVVGLWMIAYRQTNTLILVHRTQLLEQWKVRIAQFLDLSDKQVGQIGGGKQKRTGIVDVAMIQTVLGKGKVKDYIAEYGHIVVDECHHVSAFSFEQVLKDAKAKYVLGLTATLTRKDGHHPIVLMQCGPVRFRADAKKEAAERPFQHIVIPRMTGFQMEEDGHQSSIHEIYDRLIQDEKRNEQIFDDVLLALEEGRSPILLTDRTAHLAYFEARLRGFAKNIIVLKGGMGKKQLRLVQEQMERIPADEERVLLATGRFAGEGFDDARLVTLFLAMPFSWKGTLHQYAGRLHRQYEGKKEVRIYDYVDEQVPLLKRMYNKRSGGYRALGYELRD